MVEQYGIHIMWFLMSCGFGAWMYMRGATIGVRAGVKAASIYLILNGQAKDVPALLDFVDELSSGNMKDYK